MNIIYLFCKNVFFISIIFLYLCKYNTYEREIKVSRESYVKDI